MSFTVHMLTTQVDRELLVRKKRRVIERSERKWDIDLDNQCEAI